MTDLPRLRSDVGTAYDMLISLEVLYHPRRYGVRGAWAAGVRSRLPEKERAFLQQAVSFFIPFNWLHALPAPKDGATVLKALAAMPAADRLPAVTFHSPHFPAGPRRALQRVAERGGWDDEDLAVLDKELAERQWGRQKKDVKATLDLWAEPERSGENYLAALRAYYDAFFAEEEQRIRPILEEAADRALEMAGRLSLADLLEELSQGLHFAQLPEADEIVLAPSFWSTPLVVDHELAPGCRLFVFGARPSNVSLVPGEPVPEDLHRTLKALSDPTRLRILHYLSDEPQTPSSLARKLRLRPPTVVHHLHVLRLSRLVRLTMEAEGKHRYAARPEAIDRAFADLQHFVERGGPDD